jgi:hypothetical protein
LKKYRGVKDAVASDDPEFDAALSAFSAALDNVKEQYMTEDELRAAGRETAEQMLGDVRCADAYAAFKRRLDTAGAARRSRLPPDPPWQTLPKRKVKLGGDSDPNDPNERAREAYEERSRRLSDGWRYKRDKPRHAGPWLSDGVPRQELQFGRMAMVGPAGGRAFRNANMSDGEAARQRYIDRISNAWRDHRR